MSSLPQKNEHRRPLRRQRVKRTKAASDRATATTTTLLRHGHLRKGMKGKGEGGSGANSKQTASRPQKHNNEHEQKMALKGQRGWSVSHCRSCQDDEVSHPTVRFKAGLLDLPLHCSRLSRSQASTTRFVMHPVAAPAFVCKKPWHLLPSQLELRPQSLNQRLAGVWIRHSSSV